MASGIDPFDPTVTWTRTADTSASNHVITPFLAAQTLIRVRGIGLAVGPWIAAALAKFAGVTQNGSQQQIAFSASGTVFYRSSKSTGLWSAWTTLPQLSAAGVWTLAGNATGALAITIADDAVGSITVPRQGGFLSAGRSQVDVSDFLADFGFSSKEATAYFDDDPASALHQSLLAAHSGISLT